MWRSFFLAVGVFTLLVGAECLAVEQVTFKPKTRGGQVVEPAKTVQTPPWAPWSLMGGGAVVVLYSFTLPKRVSE
ncbi:MAG: hypothetical protein AAGG46_07065 [Planctomycetota bacterium]